jgi:hypothetical protein
MHRERQAVLSLIALEKITPREAERLLAAWNAGREEFWVIGACVTACLAQFLPEAERLAQSILPIGHSVAAITCWIGGVL